VRPRAKRGASMSPCLSFPPSPHLPPYVPVPTPSLPPSLPPPPPTVLRVRLPASGQSAGHVPVHHRDPGCGVPAAAAALGRVPPPAHWRVPGAGGVLHEGIQGRAGIVRGQGQRVSGRCGRGKKGGAGDGPALFELSAFFVSQECEQALLSSFLEEGKVGWEWRPLGMLGRPSK
jgi:hypothetical protein